MLESDPGPGSWWRALGDSVHGSPERALLGAAAFLALRPLMLSKELEAKMKRGCGMEAVAGATPGAEEKARAFGEYLEEMGLPAEQVLGDLGPAEVEDVLSFFYAGMPDRF